MKKCKRAISIVCFFLVFSLILSGGPSLVAHAVDLRASSQFATTVPATLKSIHTNPTLDDTAKVRQIVTLLFDVKRDQFANGSSADFDFSVFGAVNTSKGSDLLHFSRSVKAEKDTLSIFDKKAVDCETTLTFNSVVISGNTATVDVYEWLTYYYYFANGVRNSDMSGVGVNYTIDLQKLNGAWKITGIDFYNDATETLRDNSISVAEFVSNRYQVATTIQYDTERTTFGMPENTRSTNAYTFISFSRLLSCTYASLYGGEERNPNFVDYTNYGGDCQNFASQCVWYGLGGKYSSISTGGAPMINATASGSSGRAWYSLPNGAHSASWTSVTAFGNYVAAGSSSKLGLVGTIRNGVAYAYLGDVIHINDGNGDYYHAYVVTNAFGNEGSRTPADIYICAHTTDRWNQQLSDTLPGSRFRTISIDGIWLP